MRDLSSLQDFAFIGRRCVQLIFPLSRYQHGLNWPLCRPFPLLHIEQLLFDFIIVSLVLKWPTESFSGIQHVPIFDLHGEFGERAQRFILWHYDPCWVLFSKKETKVFHVSQYCRMHGLLSEDHVGLIELFEKFTLDVTIGGIIKHLFKGFFCPYLCRILYVLQRHQELQETPPRILEVWLVLLAQLQ